MLPGRTTKNRTIPHHKPVEMQVFGLAWLDRVSSTVDHVHIAREGGSQSK